MLNTPSLQEVKRYFQVLDVLPGCSLDTLKQAYKKQVRFWHPDRHSSQDRIEVGERLRLINEAFSYLSVHYAEFTPQSFAKTNNTVRESDGEELQRAKKEAELAKKREKAAKEEAELAKKRGKAAKEEAERERLARREAEARAEKLAQASRSEHEDDVEPDDADAVRWYRKAAEQGNAEAQKNLGFMYQEGRGVAQDHAEAVRWYLKAAEQGDPDAQYAVATAYYGGYGVPRNYIESAQWFRKAAEQGNVAAQKDLGFMYQEGRGVAQDDAEAVRWYRKAAEQGDADAQCNLGCRHREGRGVEWSVEWSAAEAVNWYRKAAEQDHAVAQDWLGFMYRGGQGVERSDGNAVYWFRKAAEQNLASAQRNLGHMYQEGRGVAKDHAEAVRWYRKAADAGDAWAMTSLGWMYENGQGVSRDMVQAVSWYQKAAALGGKKAQKNLKRLVNGKNRTQTESGTKTVLSRTALYAVLFLIADLLLFRYGSEFIRGRLQTSSRAETTPHSASTDGPSPVSPLDSYKERRSGQALSGPAPSALAVPAGVKSKVNPEDGLTYVWIQPGTFQMGCSPGDNECRANEEPARSVTIAQGFWMGQTEVTQEAYWRVTGKHPPLPGDYRRPAELVSWHDAQSYCQAAGMRLPTEEEWEYAARAGDTSPRYGSLDVVAWYEENSGRITHEVGQKQPNAWGLYDMLGNVSEWTANEYDGDMMQGGPWRVLRGGFWDSKPSGVRVSVRELVPYSWASWDTGIRCVGE